MQTNKIQLDWLCIEFAKQGFRIFLAFETGKRGNWKSTVDLSPQTNFTDVVAQHCIKLTFVRHSLCKINCTLPMHIFSSTHMERRVGESGFLFETCCGCPSDVDVLIERHAQLAICANKCNNDCLLQVRYVLHLCVYIS